MALSKTRANDVFPPVLRERSLEEKHKKNYVIQNNIERKASLLKIFKSEAWVRIKFEKLQASTKEINPCVFACSTEIRNLGEHLSNSR